MEFLYEIGLFVLKSIWIVVCIVFVLMAIGAAIPKRRPQGDPPEGHLLVRHINELHREIQRTVDTKFFDRKSVQKAHKDEEKQRRAELKARRKEAKQAGKETPQSEEKSQATSEAEEDPRSDVFVINFKGDIAASRVDFLRKEISAVLLRSNRPKEVVVRVESSGGFVYSYGFAASQLLRIREAGIRLTVAVDQIAASGGYMMAAVAEKIIAAPFAVVGSIGVAAELPNLYRFLQKYDIDYEVLTAGKHKRTLTVFGENRDEHREKLQEEMEETHELFQNFIAEYRKDVDVPAAATGETWYGTKALELNLVDEIKTSDQYILDACNDGDVYEVEWVMPQRPLYKIAEKFSETASRLVGWVKQLVAATATPRN